MSLSGKVFAITGGGSGIGLSTVRLLASRQATVCVADISETSLATASAMLTSVGATFSSSVVDVSDRQQVDNWITGIVSQFGRLDGAANIAGIIGPNHSLGTIADLEDDEWDRILAVNLTGCMYCLRAELRVISDGGSIVNMASIQGTIAMALHGAYGVSKHGVVALTKAAAKEVGHREIRVNAVAPGAIYTPLMQKAWQQTGRSADAPFDDPSAFQRQGKPEEIAAVVAFLLGPESTFVSGSVYGADGAWL